MDNSAYIKPNTSYWDKVRAKVVLSPHLSSGGCLIDRPCLPVERPAPRVRVHVLIDGILMKRAVRINHFRRQGQI